MMKRAKKKVALINNDKFGKEYLYNLCHVSEIDDVICEGELPEYILKFMKK
jgi:DeoR/GlpR family transcriptional regulator of sugar metabolism